MGGLVPLIEDTATSIIAQHAYPAKENARTPRKGGFEKWQCQGLQRVSENDHQRTDGGEEASSHADPLMKYGLNSEKDGHGIDLMLGVQHGQHLVFSTNLVFAELGDFRGSINRVNVRSTSQEKVGWPGLRGTVLYSTYGDLRRLALDMNESWKLRRESSLV